MNAFGGDENGFNNVAGAGQNPLEQWFFETPVCTRWWTVANVALGVLVQCKIVTPYQLFYSFRAVFVKDQVRLRCSVGTGFVWQRKLTDQLQYWRLLTTFLYISPLSMDLLFHVFFMQRYARLLEESAGRSTAHFSWLLLYATTALLLLSPLVNMPFLAHPLSTTLVYIWARRNPDTRMSFLGVLTFTAPFLPWVLIAFSVVMHGAVPKDDLMGIVVGHLYYFFADVFPAIRPGSRPMDPPRWWIVLFNGRDEQPDVRPPPVHPAALVDPVEPVDT
jgi:Derlin-2/3